MSESEPRVYGTISSDEVDTTLDASAPPIKISHRRQRETVEQSARLPKGAWLRVRASGGIVFRTSETIVFEDGRLTYRSSPTAVYGETLMARELTSTQVAELRNALAAISVAAIESPAHTGRDTVGYELSVREGRRTQTTEVFQGQVPENIAVLLDMLGECVRISADDLRG